MIRIFRIIAVLFWMSLNISAKAQVQNPIFPKGQKVSNETMFGTVWMFVIVENDSIFNYHIASVTFEPGARTNWHKHPAGQILMATDGTGYYQEKGKPIQILNKGDVIKCAPDVTHWHGASPTSSLTHIGMTNNSTKGRAVWFNRVTDEEYNALTQKEKR